MALQNANNLAATSTLASILLIAGTSFTVATGEGVDFVATNGVVQIGSEFIFYTTKTGDVFSGLIKGFDDSTPAEQASASVVTAVVTSGWLNDINIRANSATAIAGQTSRFVVDGGTEYPIPTSGTAGIIDALGDEAADGVTVDVSQSSTYSGSYPAVNALKVDTSTTTGRSHTTSELNAWWLLELSDAAAEIGVTGVAIQAQNHGNALEGLPVNVQVRDKVSQVWTTIGTITADLVAAGWSEIFVPATGTIYADAIRIQNDATAFLVLGHVEIYGTWFPTGGVRSWEAFDYAPITHTVDELTTTDVGSAAEGDVMVYRNDWVDSGAFDIMDDVGLVITDPGFGGAYTFAGAVGISGTDLYRCPGDGTEIKLNFPVARSFSGLRFNNGTGLRHFKRISITYSTDDITYYEAYPDTNLSADTGDIILVFPAGGHLARYWKINQLEASDSRNESEGSNFNFIVGINDDFWQATPGIADTWADALHRRPIDETVHADDLEFTEALAGNTALTVTGTATWTVGRSRLSGLIDGQTTQDMAAQIWPLTPTASPVTIETAVQVFGKRQVDNMAGIGFSDGVIAGSARASIATYADLTTVGARVAQSDGTFTAETASHYDELLSLTSGSLIHFRFIWSAVNTFKGYASADGVSWTRFENGDDTVTLTPTHFFLFGSTWAGAGEFIATFEYLRVTESDLSL